MLTARHRAGYRAGRSTRPLQDRRDLGRGDAGPGPVRQPQVRLPGRRQPRRVADIGLPGCREEAGHDPQGIAGSDAVAEDNRPGRARRHPVIAGGGTAVMRVLITGQVSLALPEPAAGWRAGAHTGGVRVTVRVRPGSARPGVGGEHDGALVVRVSELAADGNATAAALASVAAAFGVGRRSVTLVAGAQSRVKILDVAGADPRTLERLLARSDHARPQCGALSRRQMSTSGTSAAMNKHTVRPPACSVVAEIANRRDSS